MKQVSAGLTVNYYLYITLYHFLRFNLPKVSAAKSTPPLNFNPRTDVPDVIGYLKKNYNLR